MLMNRFIMSALAAITAVIGLLMENVWLLAAAGGFFLLALIVFGYLVIRRRSRRNARQQVAARTREDELRELGLTEVRPLRTPVRRGAAQPPVAAEVEPTAPVPDATDEIEVAPAEVATAPVTEEVAGGAAATDEAGPLPEREEEFELEPARDDSRTMLQEPDDHPIWQKHSPTAFASFLRACWAASEGQTALIAAKEADGSFALLAIRSHLPQVRKEGRFSADSFLQVAPPERPITVLEANDPLVRDLPYYRTKMNVGGVAILPVQAGTDSLYLAVDLQPDQPGFTSRQRTLLVGFADLLRTLVEHPLEEPQARGVPTRRAIISEEMERARSEDRPLALALVYRADAEAVAKQGSTAVAEAERGLRLLLEDLVRHGRLERFGELMFGAFLYDDKAQIEDWAERVQEQADADRYRVGIGVARLGTHRDADELRADAANALAEALQARDLICFARPRLR
jgi:hypothetical protein